MSSLLPGSAGLVSRKTNSRVVLDRLSSGMKPEEKEIRARIEDGSCHEELFSLKALGTPDDQFQARRVKLNYEHAARFASHLREGKDLHPVVIFRSIVMGIVDGVNREIVRLILADGFHRHHAYVSVKREAIPAYVIDVADEELEDRARLYAAMCNQVATLPRKDEDKREAIRMACAVPSCAAWTDEQIAVHCGVDPRTVYRVRREWAIEHGRPLPPSTAKKASTVKRKPAGRPSPPAPARAILAPGGDRLPEPAEVLPSLHNPTLFRAWLLEQGVVARAPDRGAVAGLYVAGGLLSGRHAIVLCGDATPEAVYAAVGKALALGAVSADGSTPVVVVDWSKVYRKIYDVAAGFGVACLTPDELVGRIKGERGGAR